MARIASRAARGVAWLFLQRPPPRSAARTGEPAPPTGRAPTTADRQPLQPARSDHGAERRHAAAGLELSSQARRLSPAACAKTKPFRSSSATRCISRSPYGAIIALDATTGAEKWRFQLPNNDTPSKRGIAYWPGGGERAPAVASIISGSRPASSTRIKASDGTLNAWFRRERRDHPQDARGDADRDERGLLAAVVSDHLQEPDHHRRRHRRRAGRLECRRRTRGRHARLGRAGPASWCGRSIPCRGRASSATTPGAENSAKNRSGVNVWGYTSLDAERGILYMPLGAPNNDRVGIDRPGNNLFSSSVVAVDANTGKYLWHFQLVHHDIWDYDTQSAPLLVDLQPRRHRRFPPSSSSTRPDLMFTLNRVTGKPIFDIEERPVPKSDVPGEQASPTQPFPVKPEPLAQNTISREQPLQGRAAASVVLRASGGRQQHEARRAVHADRLQPVQHFAAGPGRRHQLLGRVLRSRSCICSCRTSATCSSRCASSCGRTAAT